MKRVKITTADKTDNTSLCSLLKEMPMPGPIRIAYLRNPDFFTATGVEGTFSQTIIGKDQESAKVIGMGTRAVKSAYIDGIESSIGYLSSLRVLEPYRTGSYLAQAYRKLHALHQDGKAPLYLTTILNENTHAVQTLTKPRKHFPVYHDIGQYTTFAMNVKQSIPGVNGQPISVRPAKPEDLPEILHFLNTVGRTRQFFPVYTKDDFGAEGKLLKNLNPEDIMLAHKTGRLVGTAAAWNQKPFKQSLITGYSRAVSITRPLYNLWAHMRKQPSLPSAGSQLDYRFLAIPVIENNDIDVFSHLLQALFKKLQEPDSLLLAGAHENDPFFKMLSGLHSVRYLSRVYIACWADGEESFTSLNTQSPYLELGAL